MSRRLQITITELEDNYLRSSGLTGHPRDPDSPRGVTTALPFVDPAIDDPKKDEVLPPVSDPDDPRGGRYVRGGGKARSCESVGQVLETFSYTPAAAASAEAPVARPERELSGWAIVRLVPEFAIGDVPESLARLARDRKLKNLEDALRLAGTDRDQTGPRRRKFNPDDYLYSRPLVRNARFGSNVRAYLCGSEEGIAAARFAPENSLLSYWRIDCRDHPDLIEDLVDRLLRIPAVDFAYRELLANEPAAVVLNEAGATFVGDQSYLDDAPVGIGAFWAWKQLPEEPEKVVLMDCEQRWVLDHEDLKPLNESSERIEEPDKIFGDNRFYDDRRDGHHGTAVLGQLAAGLFRPETPAGLQGIASQVTTLKVVSHYDREEQSNGHVAEAIANAIAKGDLGGGDILLLEVQRNGLPVTVDHADRDAVRLATAYGVTVIEAAGNGGHDLDAYVDERGRRIFNRSSSGFEDSGSTMVGAAESALPHNRSRFSCYGSRIDCYGWGDSVTTAGYGDLDHGGNEPQKMYTGTFSGTSSAAPCVAGAAVLLQSFRRSLIGEAELLTPLRMRALLSDPSTGTPQGPDVPGHVGVMPNLRGILRRGSGLVPDIYIRSTLCDGGGGAGTEGLSPDIYVTCPEPEGTVDDRPGGSGQNAPAPGISRISNHPEPLDVVVRMRNKSLCDAPNARARVYFGEVATLVLPDMWKPIGTTVPIHVPPGDLPHEGRVDWPPDRRPYENGFYSFLAVVDNGGGTPEPVDSTSFDWGAYLEFLASPRVACRNTHWAAPDATTNFLIGGTPDRARRFDLEFIQRLPKDARVTLNVPPVIAAKLGQKDPWLGGEGGEVRLPAGHRSRFRDIRLPAGALFPAAFRLTVGEDVQTGHSFAIRQVYRGREVGRITWYFHTS